MLHDGASLHILEKPERTGQEEYAEQHNIHPTPNEKEICSSLQLKLNELSSHMQRGEDTLKRVGDASTRIE